MRCTKASVRVRITTTKEDNSECILTNKQGHVVVHELKETIAAQTMRLFSIKSDLQFDNVIRESRILINMYAVDLNVKEGGSG